MNVLSVDCAAANAGDMFSRSLHETGFAVLRNHPIPEVLLHELMREWGAFFASDEKHEYQAGPQEGDADRWGYISVNQSETAVGHSTKDIKEFYHVFQGHPVPPRCESATERYRGLSFELARRLLGWLQTYTPDSTAAALSEPLAGMLSDQSSLLRVLNYPPLDGSEPASAMRAAPHEDINLLTILPASNQPGLEVQDTAGCWHAVPCDADTLVVNSGDMLQEATDGYYPSTTHRVVNPGDGIDNVARISIPFFLAARPEVVLSERYSAGSYLSERLRLLNR